MMLSKQLNSQSLIFPKSNKASYEIMMMSQGCMRIRREKYKLQSFGKMCFGTFCHYELRACHVTKT